MTLLKFLPHFPLRTERDSCVTVEEAIRKYDIVSNGGTELMICEKVMVRNQYIAIAAS